MAVFKLKSTLWLFFLSFTLANAQSTSKINWEAHWITDSTIQLGEHSVVNFRKTFNLENLPKRFIVHLSADNHYRFYVNGTYVTRGPARGDLNHWFYESLDIAAYLKKGKNILASEVINWGPKRSFTYFSQMTSFILQGDSETEKIVNTKANSWKTFHNKAYNPILVDWIYDKSTIDFGLYLASPTDRVEGQYYPWGWEKPEFD
ncbi:MAG: alpha-L-rhamnosidase, partial [Leadbetterella sp.]